MNGIAVTKPNVLTFRSFKLYLISISLTAANILLPLVFHQFGNAGKMFLPIYFFSLVAGLGFGWRCGVLTGLMSPLLSFSLSAMPALPILGFVIAKSVVLGGFSGYLREKLPQKNIFFITMMAILLTQFLGSLLIFSFTRNWEFTISDVTFGAVGILTQAIFAPLLVQFIFRHENKNSAGNY